MRCQYNQLLVPGNKNLLFYCFDLGMINTVDTVVMLLMYIKKETILL